MITLHTRARARTRARERTGASTSAASSTDGERLEPIGPEDVNSRASRYMGTLYIGAMRHMYTIYSVK